MQKQGMKGLVLMASLILAGSAFADSSKTTVDQTGAATTSLKMSEVAPKPRIKVGYLAENTVDTHSANSGNYQYFQSQQDVNVSYLIDKDSTIQYRQYFHYNMTDYRTTNEWGIGDVAFQYDRKNVKVGAAPVDTTARLYLPTEQYTNQLGKIELRLNAELAQVLTPALTLTYDLGSRIYGYTKDQTGQHSFRVIPAVTLGYARKTLFQPYATLYEDSSWNFNSRGKQALMMYDFPFAYPVGAGQRTHFDVNTDYILLDLGSTVNVNKNLNLNAYYEGYHSWHSDSSDIAWDNGSYNLDVAITM